MFKDSLKVILKNEGGYVNHKNDRGGETVYGIARSRWADWEGWCIVDRANRAKFRSDKAFTEYLDKDASLQEMVARFYKKNFWDRLRLDEVKSSKVQMLLFDFGVNMGTASIAKFAQICAGSVADGIVGPKTIAAINNTPEKQFAFQFLLEVVERYTYIINKNQSQMTFIKGWLNRAMGMYYKVR